MIGLNFNVENMDAVLQVYNQIQIIRYTGTEEYPDAPIGEPEALSDWITVSGTDDFPAPITITLGTTYYQIYDPYGDRSDWFSSRYYNSSTGAISGWADPILGDPGDLYYDPEFPPEISYGSEDKLIIDRIRLLIGDPLGLRREYGDDAMSSIHPDGKTYELDETGWPAFITMGGKTFLDTLNPSVNGYRFLKFQEFIDETCTICSGINNVCGDLVTKTIANGVDIYYYTFRNSDRQIMAAYDNCPPPIGLTTTSANSSAYILQTAINIITKELLEDANEDGARITDDTTTYDPAIGLNIRKAILDGLKKDLADLVKSLRMSSISGVLID